MIFALWAFYLLGWFGMILKRAYKSAKNPLTPWENVPEYFKLWLPGIMINFGVTTALFVGVWRDTAFLTKMLLMVGVQKDISIPLNPFTAVLFGIASDQLADLIITSFSYVVSKVKGILPGGTDETKP